MTASAKEVIAAAVLDDARAMGALAGGLPIEHRLATAILAALDAAGYVVVPREPTGAMIGAGGVEQFKADMAQSPPRDATMAIYRAMIAAQESES